MKSLFIALCLGLLLIAGLWIKSTQLSKNVQKSVVLVQPTVEPVVYPTAHPLDAALINDLVNKWRVENNLRPLTTYKDLCIFANSRIKDIHTDWSHDKFKEYMNNQNTLPAGYYGENLARGEWSEQATLADWVHSPEHLENLKGNFNYTCVVTDGQYAVQEFGSF